MDISSCYAVVLVSQSRYNMMNNTVVRLGTTGRLHYVAQTLITSVAMGDCVWSVCKYMDSYRYSQKIVFTIIFPLCYVN